MKNLVGQVHTELISVSSVMAGGVRRDITDVRRGVRGVRAVQTQKMFYYNT